MCNIIITQSAAGYDIIIHVKEGEIMAIRVGDVVKGVITGIQPYGAFVALDDGHKGLIHISEISERFVKDVHLFVHMNERVNVKILEIEDSDHIKLSLKAVSSNKERFRPMRHSNVPALPQMIIGFASLAKKLDGWINVAYDK